jgi:hypothetical protein
MAIVASDVMLLAAQGFLNDPDQNNYTNTVLLPHVRLAVLKLEAAMLKNGISGLEVTNTVQLSVTAITGVSISSTTTPELPTDLLLPIELSERELGSVGIFIPMSEAEQLPKRLQTTTLEDWTWENEQINLVGATRDTEVQLIYQKALDAISSANSPIAILGSKLYLAAETAQNAALIIGRNTERSNELKVVAAQALSDWITAHVKETQDFPARRLPYGYARRQIRRLITRGR